MIVNKIACFLAVAAASWSPAVVGEDIVVDYLGDFVTRGVPYNHAPFGQSFVATMSQVRTISLGVDDWNPHVIASDHSMAVAIREGDGLDGDILAKITTHALRDGMDGELEWTNFIFREAVNVTPGETYTIGIHTWSARWALAQSLYWHSYPEGHIWWRGDWLRDDLGDLRFRVLEGLPPEPEQPACGPMDVDRDGDFDLRDFADWQNCFTGPRN
jgi:hypothetical protein